MGKKFNDLDTEAFYDAEDTFYRSFWDSEGSLHWGVFDDATGNDFLKACSNLNRIMAGKADLKPDSQVLDFGCGNGTIAAWLCREHACRVTGVDLSGVRIENANALKERQDPGVRERLTFRKASVAELPFADGSFSHVWSQAVIYHVHDKEAALREAYRVLAPGGRFVFDDLLKPRPDISEESRKHVYDRLLFDTDFSFASYAKSLEKAGFRVLDSRNLSDHLRASYARLAEIAGERAEGDVAEKLKKVAVSYTKMAQAVERDELGWGLYVCEK